MKKPHLFLTLQNLGQTPVYDATWLTALEVAGYARRFPPPWTVEDKNNACFIVHDASGQAVAYVYYEEEPGRRSAAKLMTRDEARRIAANIAKLPDLLGVKIDQ